MRTELASNKPAIPYRYGPQKPVIPPCFNDLSLPMNLFNVVTVVSPALTTEAKQDPTQVDDSPIVPKKSPFRTFQHRQMRSARQMHSKNLQTWKRLNRMEHKEHLVTLALPLPRTQKRSPSIGMSFPETGVVLHHTDGLCDQPLRAQKTHQCSN